VRTVSYFGSANPANGLESLARWRPIARASRSGPIGIRVDSGGLDLQGNLRLPKRSAEDGDTEILRVDSDKFTKINCCGKGSNRS